MSHFLNDTAFETIIAVLSFSLLVLVTVLFFFFCKRRRRRKTIKSEENKPTALHAPPYPLIDIDTATNGFNHRTIIGKGPLGTVHVGVLPQGELVAMKRIHPHLVLTNPGFGFSSILKQLSLAQHPNVVPILGYSQAPGERIIVTEFSGTVSLDYCLHQNPNGEVSLYDWSRRVRIAAGVARGLEYLHNGMAPNVVHGGVKPSNILVDVEMICARVCDYGVSFLAPLEKRGLEGYVDNEYWVEKRGCSKECDVYGFGVILLELLSGKRCQEGLIVHWALPLIREMKFDEFLDHRIVVPSDFKPLFRLAKVASTCVGNCRKSRPSIVQVATILNNLEIELSFRIEQEQ